ncbi:hypothetical protein ACFVUS_10380 [Nocardia sp. NPDC058058]|uniref:hypothetical protein n=1 Tax=Nocardia sp. NPDC058058 TaxID=3346317 RepID=UPI0036D9EBD0
MMSVNNAVARTTLAVAVISALGAGIASLAAPALADRSELARLVRPALAIPALTDASIALPDNVSPFVTAPPAPVAAAAPLMPTAAAAPPAPTMTAAVSAPGPSTDKMAEQAIQRGVEIGFKGGLFGGFVGMGVGCLVGLPFLLIGCPIGMVIGAVLGGTIGGLLGATYGGALGMADGSGLLPLLGEKLEQPAPAAANDAAAVGDTHKSGAVVDSPNEAAAPDPASKAITQPIDLAADNARNAIDTVANGVMAQLPQAAPMVNAVSGDLQAMTHLTDQFPTHLPELAPAH